MSIMIADNKILTVPGKERTYQFVNGSSLQQTVMGIGSQITYISNITVHVRTRDRSTTYNGSLNLTPARGVVERTNFAIRANSNDATINFQVTPKDSGATLEIKCSVISDGGSLVLVDSFVNNSSFTMSNGGGNDGVGLLTIADEWDPFPYWDPDATADTGYPIPQETGSTTRWQLTSRYWFPLKLVIWRTGSDTPYTRHIFYDMSTGYYCDPTSNDNEVFKYNIASNTLEYCDPQHPGVPPTNVYGWQWIAMSQHEQYCPSQLLATMDDNDKLQLTSNAAGNRLYLNAKNYTESPFAQQELFTYYEYPKDSILALNGKLDATHVGWDLSEPLSTPTHITYSKYNFNQSQFAQNYMGTMGISFISPIWAGKMPTNTLEILSDTATRQALLSGIYVLSQERTLTPHEGFVQLPIRQSRDLMPVILHYRDTDSGTCIIYDPHQNPPLQDVSDEGSYIGSQIGFDNEFLYLAGSNNYHNAEVFVCYAYRDARNLQSFVQDTQYTLQAIMAYNSDGSFTNHSSYFWVGDEYFACDDTTWGSAVNGNTWGHMLRMVGFSTTSLFMIAYKGQLLHQPDGSPVGITTPIINGAHYYTE